MLLVPGAARAQHAPLAYTINLNDRADDLFKVTLTVKGLTPDNAVYQFASTAPGTYQVMNIGRFVQELRGVRRARTGGAGRAGVREPVAALQRAAGANDQVHHRGDLGHRPRPPDLSHVRHVARGRSRADQPPRRDRLSDRHANDAGAAPAPYPAGWTVGTALDRAKDGRYIAKDYDQLVDSPILLGRLTTAQTRVTGVPVEIYTYSKTGLITSPQLLGAMNGMLQAAGRFLGTLPVPRYTFLYAFTDTANGAWEHSLSSEYVLKEGEFTDSLGKGITDIAAHEFFHVVTPLNIHSEIIEHFNFVTPVPSEHLWLYEGTTEWAAHTMQLRGGAQDARDIWRR